MAIYQAHYAVDFYTRERDILQGRTFYPYQQFEARDKIEAQQLAEEFVLQLSGSDDGMYKIPSLKKIVEVRSLSER